jgi:hypothetical protein
MLLARALLEIIGQDMISTANGPPDAGAWKCNGKQRVQPPRVRSIVGYVDIHRRWPSSILGGEPWTRRTDGWPKVGRIEGMIGPSLAMCRGEGGREGGDHPPLGSALNGEAFNFPAGASLDNMHEESPQARCDRRQSLLGQEAALLLHILGMSDTY